MIKHPQVKYRQYINFSSFQRLLLIVNITCGLIYASAGAMIFS